MKWSVFGRSGSSKVASFVAVDDEDKYTLSFNLSDEAESMDHPDKLWSRTTSSSSSFKFNPFGDEGQVEESKTFQDQDEAGVLYSTPRLHRQDLAETPLQAQDDVGTTGGMASVSMASTLSGLPGPSQRSLSGSTSSSLSLLDLKASLPVTSLSLVSPHISLPSVSLSPHSSLPLVSPARTSFSTSLSQHSPVAALYSSSPQPYPPSTGSAGNPTYFPPPVSTPLASGAYSVHAQSSSMSSTPSARAPHMQISHSVQQPPSKQPPILSTRSGSKSRESGIPPLSPPVAGFRVPATGSKRMASFPLLEMCGPAFADCDGNPVYVCSAILGNAVHPGE